MHSIGVLSPGTKVVLVQGELLGQGGDVGGVFVEEYLQVKKSQHFSLYLNLSYGKGDLQCQHQPSSPATSAESGSSTTPPG